MPVRKARQIMSNNALKALSESGVSVWLDDISRERLRTGNLAKLMSTHHVVGVTSNPTIFDKALAERSEERRVGKECGCGRQRDEEMQKKEKEGCRQAAV